jgi:hypothetical protein
MTLEERLKKNAPTQSKANLKGGDKTKIEADGGLDLSKDEKAIAKAGGRTLGNGGGGFTQSKPYSNTFK